MQAGALVDTELSDCGLRAGRAPSLLARGAFCDDALALHW
jgi:hypothetical protein